MTKSHWCDRLRPICSGGGGRGRLRACGMRGMNRCDIWNDWHAQMSAMPGMWVQSAVCADVARCGSGMSGMWLQIEHISLLTRCQIIKQKCTTFAFRWGSAPDPIGVGYSDPETHIAVFKGFFAYTSRGAKRRGEGN